MESVKDLPQSFAGKFSVSQDLNQQRLVDNFVIGNCNGSSSRADQPHVTAALAHKSIAELLKRLYKRSAGQERQTRHLNRDCVEADLLGIVAAQEFLRVLLLEHKLDYFTYISQCFIQSAALRITSGKNRAFDNVETVRALLNDYG